MQLLNFPLKEFKGGISGGCLILLLKNLKRGTTNCSSIFPLKIFEGGILDNYLILPSNSFERGVLGGRPNFTLKSFEGGISNGCSIFPSRRLRGEYVAATLYFFINL